MLGLFIFKRKNLVHEAGLAIMQIQAAAQRLKTFLELVNTLNYTCYKQYMLPAILHFVF